MEKYGFIRVSAASPRVKVADVEYNTARCRECIDRAEADGVSLLVLPELGISGSTCGDLFVQKILIEKSWIALEQLAEYTSGKAVTAVVGLPVFFRTHLYNCAAVISKGRIAGVVPKMYLPNYGEFYEARWFASGVDLVGVRARLAGDIPFDPFMLFTLGEATFGIEICEDMWTAVPPSTYHALAGAHILLNLSASNEVISKREYRNRRIIGITDRTISAYVYASCGYGESTQDLVYSGATVICENGSVLSEGERFRMDGEMITADLDLEKLVSMRQKKNDFYSVSPDAVSSNSYVTKYEVVDLGEDAPTDFNAGLRRHVERHPFAPVHDPEEISRRAEEVLSIQVTGLATRLEHIGHPTAVIGISGGLDSTLALLVAVKAFDALGWDRKGIVGVTMPGFGTTDRTYTNAVTLIRELGVTFREVSIAGAVRRHFEDIGHDPDVHDVTYENSQARERTQILMDIANQTNGIVVGTGDLSEMALGWCTYNGDHMSMYGVNSDVPKTLVKHIVRWAAENRFAGTEVGKVLLDVVDTPISPELTPADSAGNIKQKTEDLVGPYELHDFFLYNVMKFGYSPRKVFFLACKAFNGQKSEKDGSEYTPEVIAKWLRKFFWRFFLQQFKRSCSPDGPKVGSVALSPRGDWRMPTDAQVKLWLQDLDEMGF